MLVSVEQDEASELGASPAQPPEECLSYMAGRAENQEVR
jgi:hypothetical protein